MTQPRLIVVDESHRSDWHSLTWEQRQGERDEKGRITKPGMAAKDLVIAMGPLHCKHPEFKGDPPVISVVHRHENLVGRHDSSFAAVYRRSLWGSIKTLCAWALQ